eukprot:scaffold15919_cov90-Cyclotella_meneghiniana.AAC.4
MTVLRLEYKQPWDGQNRPWGRYKPASSTVTVSGCRDGANPKFLTSSSYGVSSTSANRLLVLGQSLEKAS